LIYFVKLFGEEAGN
jgi:mRNA interferase MazF